MGQEQKPKEIEGEPAKLTDEQREEIQSIVNGALGAHAKRTEKLITDTLTKALEPLKAAKPTEEPPEKTGGKDEKNAELRALQKRVEESERKFAESEKARAAEVEARRRDAAQAQLRSHFESIGVRKEALDILVTAAAANGTLRYDDDGKPMIAVKRSRAKGAAAEEQTFDDFKQGVEDWSKTPEAAVFIKPPETRQNGQQRTAPGNGSAPKVYAKEPVSEEDAISRVQEILASQSG